MTSVRPLPIAGAFRGAVPHKCQAKDPAVVGDRAYRQRSPARVPLGRMRRRGFCLVTGIMGARSRPQADVWMPG